jgi:alpha-L-fucosidase
MVKRWLIISLLFIAFFNTSNAQTVYQPEWSSLDSRPTPQWWQDAKFGIFIHWGVYSVPAFTAKGNYAEWYQHSLTNNAHNGIVRAFHERNYGAKTYYDLADDFHAELYNPAAWAELFEKAGAKYVVLTSKHHDGYCLWPNKTANKTWGFSWNSVDRGPGRDLLGELFTALRKTSVRPGLYFSLYEWYNPLWKFDKSRFAADHSMPQLLELVNTYQPDVVWADGDWDATPDLWQSQQFLAWLYNMSPVRDRVVVNDRWGSGVRFNHGGIYTPEYQPDLDFENHPWEESRGMGHSYGYNRAEDAWDYNSGQSLVLHLIDKVSRGGNFLLDIGPDAHGQIPPIMQERLLTIGNWLNVNGEAIYNTRRWRTDCQWSAGRQDYEAPKGTDWLLKQTIEPDSGYAVKEVFFTWNPTTQNLYAILPQWPTDRRLILKNMQIPSGTEIKLLEGGQNLRFDNVGGNTVYVYFPEYIPSKYKATEAYVIRIKGFGDFVGKPEISVNYSPQNMQPVISIESSTPGAEIRYALGSEPLTSKSRQYQQPFTVSENTVVRARAFQTGKMASKLDSAAVQLIPYMPSLSMFRQPDAGLQALLFSPYRFEMNEIERGQLLSAVNTQTIQLAPECQSGKCGMVWKGYINIPETGGYQFWTTSDDGSMLYLDSKVIVDNDGNHGSRERSGYAYLQKGWHNIKLVYFNSGGAADLKLEYAPIGSPVRQELPSGALGH